jgi:hypothetical protein
MLAAQSPAVVEFSGFEQGEDIFFPNRLVAWSLKYYWLIALFPLVLLLISDVTIALAENEDIIASMRSDLSDEIFLSVVIGSIIGVSLLRRPLKSAPAKLIELSQNGSLQPKSASAEDSGTFSDRFRADITSTKRWTVIAILVILALLFSVYSIVSRSYLMRIEAELKLMETAVGSAFLALHFLARWVIAPILITFVFGSFLWIVICLANTVSVIPETFHIRVQPSHPDRSGGLRRLGEICLDMALPLISFAVIAAWWAVYVVIVRDRPEDVIGVFSIISLILLIAVAFITFFGPLWSIHRSMLRSKADYQDRVGRDLQQIENRLAIGVRDRDGDELERLLKEHEALSRLGETARQYPAWPFDSTIILAVAIPQFLSICGFAMSVFGITI